ncbi:hypothetical protein A9Q87_05205 [Flavobacteriales bacterium 34_180_T64]|nr:hypothetical protein A9Q87_05205 [Flavobacteriales bacterium 34_180_T64]
MSEIPELYFKTDTEWRHWLSENHGSISGIYLIFYKLETKIPTMRWEEAVKVALCFGWIDSTVKGLGDGKRRQYFTPRNTKSVWSALNKRYIIELTKNNLMHKSGIERVEIAKLNGSWIALDDVENEVIPKELKAAFSANKIAYKNYQKFSPSYRKGYLYWLNQAKRENTRKDRIEKIIEYCENNIKTRDTR